MSSPLNFELTITDLIIPNYSGPIKCALVLANFSTTISIPCKPLHMVNVKLDPMDKLYLSVFTNSSEVGCLEIPYSSFASADLEAKFRLFESSISPEKERRQLKQTGELFLKISQIEEICQRCEGLEKLVRDIKMDLDEFEDFDHNHPVHSQSVSVKEEKKSTGLQKTAKKALRSGKSVQNLSKSVNNGTMISQSANPVVVQGHNSSMISQSANPVVVQGHSATSSLGSIQADDSDLRKMLEESYKARQDLQLSVSETTEQLSLHLREQREVLEQALADRASAADQVNELNEKIDQLKQENEKLKAFLDEKEAIIGSLKPKAGCTESFENELSQVAEELEKSLSENSQLEKKLQESMDSFGNSNSSSTKRIQDLTNDKADLLSKLEELVKQNSLLKQENDKYSNLINELLGQIAILQAEVQAAKARENRERHLMKLLKDEETAKKLLKKEFDELAEKFADQTSKFTRENKRLLEEKAARENEILKLRKRSEDQEKEALGMHKDLEKSRSELAGLEQHLRVTEDLNLIVDQLSKQTSDYDKKNKTISSQLKTANEIIEQNEEAMRLQNDKIAELEAIRVEQDEQLTSLENIIDELRKDREIYKPTRDDPIDIALSDYVNTRPAGLKVQFDREDHGIYNFGTKKIFVKLEQGKLLIRVGGGYMQVEDFVKLYSPVELERFSALKKEQAQKMRQSYLGKYADKLATNKGNESPERAIKLLKDQMASGSYTPYYAVQMKSPERASNNRSPVNSDRISRNSSN